MIKQLTDEHIEQFRNLIINMYSNLENLEIPLDNILEYLDTLLSKEKEALAYSIMRMPATFCAVMTALKNTRSIAGDLEIKTVLDIGAGTGRYSIALYEEGYDVTAVELFKCNVGEDVKLTISNKNGLNSRSVIVKVHEW